MIDRRYLARFLRRLCSPLSLILRERICRLLPSRKGLGEKSRNNTHGEDSAADTARIYLMRDGFHVTIKIQLI